MVGIQGGVPAAGVKQALDDDDDDDVDLLFSPQLGTWLG